MNKLSTKISVIIPCYNEKNTILEILKRVKLQKENFNLEVIVSDDGSRDGTLDFLKKREDLYDLLLLSDKNSGKGAAIKRGIEKASGKIILIQDADLEYNPNDYDKLIRPFLENDADVVFGSRFMGSSAHRLIYYSHRIANLIITNLVNLLTNINFSDVETGYKVFKKSLLRDIKLVENSFGIEIEITMKFARIKAKIFEVGISYNGRSYNEGKKITIKDAFIAIYLIFKYFFLNLKKVN